MIRVLLVDDQHLVRMGLRMLCDAAPDLEIVAEAEDGRAAVRLAAEHVPDVILMDLRMPGVDGITATRRIMAERPSSRVVVLTTFDDDDHLYPALSAGAFGFLVKDSPPRELLRSIRMAAEGDAPYSRAVLARLVDRAVHARTDHAPADIPGLSPREQQVLRLVGEGLTNPEIAERLHLGVTTVKTHVAGLMRKTGCPNRIRLAVLATRTGATD
ncbi:response regulator transcription factor [Thermomonospora umbrina]|uniref:LuxR family two component transcriptional regulator n=1 Tax=Thermomonospora umbrina TaxID=111806 RepID=A0A3D9T1U5_9ACTN|nr:response regulator transcription factor [Thermomonospora umbrina]REE98724.1 LuxR family two component transcriptional regulator [Thermomonospora umbrina]